MNRKIRNEILAILNDRVPNFVSETFILRKLSKYPEQSIKELLTSLVEDKILEKQEDPRTVTGHPVMYYRMVNVKGIPIQETIRIGDIEVPRLLSDSSPKFLPETLNEQIEGIAEVSASLEKRFKAIVKKEQSRYWANVIGILGIVIAILALIITGLPKITTDANLPFWDVVKLNLAQLLPIAIVLALMVLILRWIVR